MKKPKTHKILGEQETSRSVLEIKIQFDMSYVDAFDRKTNELLAINISALISLRVVKREVVKTNDITNHKRKRRRF